MARIRVEPIATVTEGIKLKSSLADPTVHKVVRLID
jgi:hypothetical protein